ncbi:MULTISPECIES: class I SAM-dependent methyltransferase [unclassified Variovorax]|jgi:SAM-dependent methyltransferase|uniref:class I SAM-dependent methyltransferase n=1 Tax=unclassified Variovorax TaxID=663243 RepID=UPI000F7D640C|nr:MULTISPECIES: class I SAM-dependent methyltransferase [unclassified Variovorax]RSZ44347.1 class I SAM-dependent methyltransferase [Variovorax sp. 553]RSZ45618.1 class I SAM-dependent methyltransferase [Variovorax sp. 679]
MKCRHCHAELSLQLMDLGSSPPSNAYLGAAQLAAPEKWYPLRVLACSQCWLVQTEDYAHYAELFSSDYAYFSSYSTSWLAHSKRYVDEVVRRFALSPASHVVEVAANDGYLLQYVQQAGIPCTGIEPTAGTARAAREKGLSVVEAFFGVALARQLVAEGKAADLIAANNVLAHVPDINDFVAGFAELLKPHGVATFEFPHLMRLVADCQFDTIYHEHFSYLSLSAVHRLFEANGLCVFDVEELATHGGSLRVFAQRRDTGERAVEATVARLLAVELDAGLTTPAYYEGFQSRADDVRDGIVTFLIEARRAGKRVGAYGAAAKGNTLLNYAGIRPGLLPWVVDRNPAKQGQYMPGSRIPIVDEARLQREKPDYVLILPWNLKAEVMSQLAYIREWGGQFVCAVPGLEVL